MNKNDFKYLSQEFDNNILDLVKQKGFYPYEYMNDFEKFQDEMASKEKFYSFLLTEKLMTKNINMFFYVWDKFKMKIVRDCRDFKM